MWNRRLFLKKAGMGAGLVLTGQFPFRSLAGTPTQKVTILHTNDVHSRLEPFSTGKYKGLGGVARRAALIRRIRSEEQNVLVLDAGDVFQGTPYFNFFKGEPEIKAMTLMGYDAMTIGNHDFDAGMNGLADQLAHAEFPVVCSNYDFTGTVLEGKTTPWILREMGAVRVGILGLGIQLAGLVSENLYRGTTWLEPVQMANTVSRYLRKREHCDLIICLSHLGYSYPYSKTSDLILARETEYIDVIVGGHTHTFLETPTVIKNRAGKPVWIHQVGWGGIRLGRLDFVFDHKKSSKLAYSQSVIMGKQTRGR